MIGNIHRKTPAKMFFSKLELFKLAKKKHHRICFYLIFTIYDGSEIL